MSQRDGVHDRDRWEESDDWFAEPEAAGRWPAHELRGAIKRLRWVG